MKLIFMDVDGVLNNSETAARAPSGNTGIEDKLVQKLAHIVGETDAKIILTSDWKIEWEEFEFCCSEDAKYLNRKLKKQGIKITSKTYDEHVYDTYFEDRGKGIHKFLDKVQNLETYVVIDDHIFTDFERVNNNGINIYGYGFTDFYSKKVELPQDLDNSKTNILVMHADLNGTTREFGEYNSILESELQKTNFDYIALGHIHKSNIEDKGKIIYPGSLTAGGFDELGKHGMIVRKYRRYF